MNVMCIVVWNFDMLLIYELGFDEVVKECCGKNLFFFIDVIGMI